MFFTVSTFSDFLSKVTIFLLQYFLRVLRPTLDLNKVDCLLDFKHLNQTEGIKLKIYKNHSVVRVKQNETIFHLDSQVACRREDVRRQNRNWIK